MTPNTATSDESQAWMSAHAAAEVLGDSKVKVLNAVIGGSLIGKRIAGRVIVLRESVEAEIERRKASAANSEAVAAQ